MKSLFPSSTKSVETLRLSDDNSIDVYVWTSPENVKIATHMIMSCPSCGYPLSMASSEFDFDKNTLGQELKCPARWKKQYTKSIKGKTLNLVEVNEKGRPIIQRCGWKGFIVDNKLISKKNLG